MKTAISIPDPIFEAAEGLAKRLGMSKSELYTNAVSEYMDSHKNKNVTEALNNVYGTEPSVLDKEVAGMQNRSIPQDNW